MNMTQCEREGLYFEGGTAEEYDSSEIEKLKKEAKEIRSLGFRAICAKSLKSEWGGGSYVLMVEEKYFEYKKAKDHIYYIQNEETYIKSILEEANKKIEEIKSKASEYRELCNKYNIKY